MGGVKRRALRQMKNPSFVRGPARNLAQAAVLVSLTAVAFGSRAGVGGGESPSQRPRSWYVVHGPTQDEDKVFGFVAGPDAMEPAMTISMRPRVRQEPSGTLIVRQGTSVGICPIEDEDEELAAQPREYPDELAALHKMKPKERRRPRLVLRGGSDKSGSAAASAADDGEDESGGNEEEEEDRVAKRARTDGGPEDEPASGCKEAAGSADTAATDDGVLDVHNETALEITFNTATDCDALEAMYLRVLAKDDEHVSTLQHYGNLLMRIRRNYTGVAALAAFRVLCSVLSRGHVRSARMLALCYERVCACELMHACTLVATLRVDACMCPCVDACICPCATCVHVC
jgi:hypothetical protein